MKIIYIKAAIMIVISLIGGCHAEVTWPYFEGLHTTYALNLGTTIWGLIVSSAIGVFIAGPQ